MLCGKPTTGRRNKNLAADGSGHGLNTDKGQGRVVRCCLRQRTPFTFSFPLLPMFSSVSVRVSSVALSSLLPFLLLPDGAVAQPLDGREGRNLLLENFRPQSAMKVPEHRLTKAKFPVVDVHTHFRIK